MTGPADGGMTKGMGRSTLSYFGLLDRPPNCLLDLYIITGGIQGCKEMAS